jgi:NAD(P)-dependent dehydrogenase (short-subunit alcohol dehydrogenase family)
MKNNSPEYTPDFSGSLVVVTGAGGGVGGAIARVFAAAGASVALHFRSSVDAVERLERELTAAGTEARAVQADLSASAGADALVAAVEAWKGIPDVLVNAAGSYPVTPLLEMDEARWRPVIQENLDSTVFCTGAAARRMRERGSGGVVINIASIEGLTPKAGHSHYCAAKAGVLMFTRSAAWELGGAGIRVNAISPGLIAREGIETTWPQGVAAWRATAPLGRMGEAREVAAACLFLASPAAAWITGANLVMDGGASCRPVF